MMTKGKMFPTAHQAKRPQKGPSTEVEARAGVEPTYTDLQSRRALGAHGATEVRRPRAARRNRLIRAFLGTIFPTLALTACGGGGSPPEPPPARIAITFDYHATTPEVAYPLLKAHGLTGTFFVDPSTVDSVVTTDQLRQMQGWSIQTYSGVNMVELLAAEGEAGVRAKFAALKRDMSAKGFVATFLAPAGRAWNNTLRDISRDYFAGVRVVSNTSAWQQYPFPDPHFINDGATASLSATDTAESLSAQLKSLQRDGGLWIVVIHKVGDDSDPAYSVPTAVLDAFAREVASEVRAGRLVAMTL